MGLILKSIPLGSLQTIPSEQRASYLDSIVSLPKNIQDLLFLPKTGAYIRGLVRTYNLPEESAPKIAFMVLEISLGKLALAQMGPTLSSRLSIANDKAQKMAQEIEHDVFAPIAGELNAYVAAQKQQPAASAAASARQAGATNVLNLKQPTRPVPPPKPPTPPQIPRPPKY